MSDFDPIYAATEAKYNIPPGLLKAQGFVESRFNPKAVSPQGAQGIAQLMPATAKSLGADPFDPAQAIDAQGRLMAQNLKASGGDIDRAAMMYHGGTDTRQWGPKTHAYPAKLAAALGPQPQQGGGDPIEAALSGQAPQSQPAPSAAVDQNDPIESALSRGTGAPHAPVPNGSMVHPAGGSGSQAGAAGGSVPNNGAGRNVLGPQAGTGPGAQGTAPGGLQQNSLNAVTNAVGGVTDAAMNGLSAGLVKPFNAALDTVIPNAVNGQKTSTVWDGSSLSDAFHKNLGLERGQAEQFSSDHPVASGVGEVAGALASPFNKLFAPAEGAGLLSSIPRFMGQGAAYGFTRGMSDTGDPKTAGIDAVIGAGLAPAGAAAADIGGKVLGAALRARSSFANAIPQSLKQQVAGMIDHGASAQQIFEAYPDAKDIAHVGDWVKYRAGGGKNPVAWGDAPPAPVTDDNAPIVITASRNKQLAAALGTQGSRRGIEAVTDLPAPVQADVQRLTNAGISPEEAQREADISYVGAKPTVAAVTRDPQEQLAFNEGAKDTSTPSGQALNDTQAGNNQAIHDTLINTVENYGGVPAQGEAAQTAAEALAKASDAQRAKVTQLYKAARATDGDVKVNTDELREALQSPELSTPTNPQVKQLSDGINAYLQNVDQRAGTTLRTPEQIEDIRQLANSAYDPMGGAVNSAVSRIGRSLNDGLDQLDNASAAYKAARAAHRDWANQYADPQGVANLIQRDAQGNFLNADNWRKAENGAIGTIADKPFIQAVGQLKKIGATDALDRLKASVVQQAYERATNSARDARGNPMVNGKLFQAELNKIGIPKLKALFSSDEIAHLATVGRAARTLNEPVPGTLNTSNTSIATATRSSLAQALQAKPGSHPVFSALKLGSAAMGHIPAAVAIHGAEQLSNRAAQNAIGQGVREQLNPALARALGSRSSAKIENSQFRTAVGRALRNRGAIPAANNDRGKAIGRKLSNAL